MKKIAWTLLPLLLLTVGLMWWNPFCCSESCDNGTVVASYQVEPGTHRNGPASELLALAQKPERMDKMSRPSDHYSMVRSYPDKALEMKALEAGMDEVRSQVTNAPMANTQTGLANTPWTLQGPTNIGGRLNTIAIDPNSPQTILVGASAGGIFKTTDGGFNCTASHNPAEYTGFKICREDAIPLSGETGIGVPIDDPEAMVLDRAGNRVLLADDFIQGVIEIDLTTPFR